MDLRLSTVVLTTSLLSVLLVTFANAIITSPSWCEPGQVCLGRGLGFYKKHVISCECPAEYRQVHEGEGPVHVPSKCTYDFRRRSFQCKPYIREWADKKKNNYFPV